MAERTASSYDESGSEETWEEEEEGDTGDEWQGNLDQVSVGFGNDAPGANGVGNHGLDLPGIVMAADGRTDLGQEIQDAIGQLEHVIIRTRTQERAFTFATHICYYQYIYLRTERTLASIDANSNTHFLHSYYCHTLILITIL